MLGLCGLQFGDRGGLNNMPFARVQPLVSDLARAQSMAKKGNIEFLAGQAVMGQAVRLRGEFTDGNCYLAKHSHGYDHAFCAKFCVAANSPLVFVSDDKGKLFVVLNGRNGVPVSEDILDRIGVPGVEVSGKLIEVGGLEALSVSKLEQ